MSEKNFWNLVRNNLDLKMYRVENRVAVGMPDVHYISGKSSGWIELKFIPSLPKKGKIKTGRYPLSVFFRTFVTETKLWSSL